MGAKVDLEFHRAKIRQMQEELTQAEVWERQLEQRIIRTKEMLKPPILKFSEQLESCKAVDEADIEATFGDKNVNADKVIKILRRKALEESHNGLGEPDLRGEGSGGDGGG